MSNDTDAHQFDRRQVLRAGAWAAPVIALAAAAPAASASPVGPQLLAGPGFSRTTPGGGGLGQLSLTLTPSATNLEGGTFLAGTYLEIQITSVTGRLTTGTFPNFHSPWTRVENTATLALLQSPLLVDASQTLSWPFNLVPRTFNEGPGPVPVGDITVDGWLRAPNGAVIVQGFDDKGGGSYTNTV